MTEVAFKNEKKTVTSQVDFLLKRGEEILKAKLESDKEK